MWTWLPWSGRRHLGTEADRATFRTLHAASLAAPALRSGLTPEAAERAAHYLRSLLGAPSIAVTDSARLLAWEGPHRHHATTCREVSLPTVAHGHTEVVDRRQIGCERPDCPVQNVIVAPLHADGRVVGTLQVYTPKASALLVRATNEVAGWVSGQLELAELDASRSRAMEAEVQALRAQISPHFIYNSLASIAAFMRTDAERARELLLDFADFTRYSFRRHGQFTTLAEEIRSIELYLVLEKARFGDRLEVDLKVAPEVLPVVLPFLSIQPLVENAVQHGLADKTGTGHVSIVAEDAEQDCVIMVEDDGAGEDPETVRRALGGDTGLDSVGLGNVDERLRTAFGDEYGLVVETAPHAGTRVIVRVPKYAPGVHT